MRICWTILREYKKMHGKVLRDDLIQDLQDMGLPKEIAETLLSKDNLQWQGRVDDADTFIGLDILD